MLSSLSVVPNVSSAPPWDEANRGVCRQRLVLRHERTADPKVRHWFAQATTEHIESAHPFIEPALVEQRFLTDICTLHRLGHMWGIWIAFTIGVLGLVVAILLAVRVMKKSPGSEDMVRISDAVYEGAMAFLKREYRVVVVFVISVSLILLIGLRPEGMEFAAATAFAYLVGAAGSLLAGFFGLRISTRANTRTAEAARRGMNDALLVAFRGGAVMGLTVVSIGLFCLSALILIYSAASSRGEAVTIGRVVGAITGFSMGASSVALFARVGGGVYTKAADVGADLVGKVEAGIPEDDPRNPATIADNVGDNVGDVAGMGADLYESYVG